MGAIDIKTVRTPAEKQLFITSQWSFYRGDSNWVPPLIMERKKLLDTATNPFYQHSEIELFLAVENGEVVGRIAAITNERHNAIHQDNIGFFGFFECRDRQDVANALFMAAEHWLRSKGKTGMRGPVNPSMNDESGLLVEGFHTPPVILMTYNQPYYGRLIENEGLSKVKDLYSYAYGKEDYQSEKLARMQNCVRQRNNITVRQVDFKNPEQYARDLELLKFFYNKVWEPNWGFVNMTDEEFYFLAKDLRQIADPAYALIGEVNGHPAGFILSLPDINQVLIHNKSGRLLPLLWHLMTKKKRITNLRTIVLGVLPEYRRTGVDAVLVYETGVTGEARGLTYGEAGWILEDNVEMNNVMTSSVNGRVEKVYRLYQKDW